MVLPADAILESADDPTLRDARWLEATWDRARNRAPILAIDEIQKIPQWAETVKRLWDEDTRKGVPLKVVLLGSSTLLLHQGLTESLAGRFEVIRVPHWSFREVREAFGFTLEDWVYWGAYPGAAPFKSDFARWSAYVRDSLIETTVSRDILQMERIQKPALLRRLFELGALASGQILSFQKMIGQLTDVGNATTLAHYLGLLGNAGMLQGLEKFAGTQLRQKASSPKFQVHNNALLTALAQRSLESVRGDPELWGRWVESAVGAHLLNLAFASGGSLRYWRDRSREVDFVLSRGEASIAIEVKSGLRKSALPGLAEFSKRFSPVREWRVGGAGGLPVEEFVGLTAEELFGQG